MSFMEPDYQNNKDNLKADLKKWAYWVEDYFEKNTAAHIFVKVFLVLLAVVGGVLDLLDLEKNYWSPTLTYFFFISLIVIILVIDFAHVTIAKRRKVELNRVKRIVDNMAKIIRGASELQKADYKIIDWFIEHDIDINGDVRYKRVMKIGYLNEIVYWVRIPIAVIDGSPEDKAEDLSIDVTNAEDGGKLPWAIIEETDKRKVLAVMLEPPVTPTENSSFRLSFTWRGAYRPLIHDFQDRGKITVEHPTDRVHLRIMVPRGLEIASIRLRDKIGTQTVTKQEDGRSIMNWVTDNPPKGEHSYTLICKKIV